VAKRKAIQEIVQAEDWLYCEEFFGLLLWIDGRPLLSVIEPYRLRAFKAFLDPVDGKLRYNLGLLGRAKKNWKSADLVLAAFFTLLANDSIGGNEILVVASDLGQADEDLSLAKKLVEVNPVLAERVIVRETAILRADGRGRLRILPGRDVSGEHGKSYRALFIDEIHTQRTWDLLEALSLDPTRPDAQMWITSYASLHHKPGVPLFDLMAIGKAGTDPRMLFSWYGADYTTDPDFQTVAPEVRANPSMNTWPEGEAYLQQQQLRLPGHKFRRLHLNLGGLPEGAAYTVEKILDAIPRGVTSVPYEEGIEHVGYVDMSGGSNDEAYLAVGKVNRQGQSILCRLENQGGPVPFDPRKAVARFSKILDEYHVSRVYGDRFGGQTFVYDFLRYGKTLLVSQATTSQVYEALEPRLNAGEIVLLDHAVLEMQLLGLIWKGQKITHPSGEHDDAATAAAGALLLATEGEEMLEPTPSEQRTLDSFAAWAGAPSQHEVVDHEAGFQHDDMAWRRTDERGISRSLW
jgi:hypothetical protein